MRKRVSFSAVTSKGTRKVSFNVSERRRSHVLVSCNSCDSEWPNEFTFCPDCGYELHSKPVPPPKPRFVQLLNPITKHYVKIDRLKGGIVSHKRTKGPYKNVPITTKNTSGKSDA